VHAEDGDSADAGTISEPHSDSEIGRALGLTAAPAPAPLPDTAGSAADAAAAAAESETATAVAEPDVQETAPEKPEERGGLPLTNGIGCAALLLPLLAVAGAIASFVAGVLSTSSGCSAHGSALCSSSGPLFAFGLPVFVSPLAAAATAIGAVTVRRHRSTWLAVGYGIVFISVIVGLASASTGSG
jgi:hypothetical protein